MVNWQWVFSVNEVSTAARNMKTQWAFGFHAAACAVYAFGAYYDAHHVLIPGTDVPPRNFGGRWKFLTFWDTVLQAMYFGLCVVSQIHSWTFPRKLGINTKLNQIIDFFFTIVAFPLGLFVCGTFWGLWFWDRELVFPKILDLHFPWWLNQIVHTLILPTSLIEMFAIPHRYPRKSIGIPALILLPATYLIWILYLAYSIDVWVYPILAVLDDIQRIIFISVIFFFFVALYCVGEMLNRMSWGDKSTKTMTKKRE